MIIALIITLGRPKTTPHYRLYDNFLQLMCFESNK